MELHTGKPASDFNLAIPFVEGVEKLILFKPLIRPRTEKGSRDDRKKKNQEFHF